MVIEISSGVIIGAVLAYVGQAIAFLIWVKIEVSVLKKTIESIEYDKKIQLEAKANETEKLEAIISKLSEKIETFQTNTSMQMFDLNGKVTRAVTLAEVHNVKK